MSVMFPDNIRTFASTCPRQRIFRLVVGHVVVGLTAALVAHFAPHHSVSPALSEPVLFGLVFSQAILLGVWGSLGASSWRKRLVGVIVGIGCLVPLLGVGFDDLDLGLSLLVVVVTAFVTMVLSTVRLFRVRIQLESTPANSANRIQFHIRHLMTLTFVVACLVSVGKAVQPYVSGGKIFLDILPVAVVCAVVGVMPVWFVLATRHAVVYGVGTVAVGACAGYYFGRNTSTGFELIWMTATATEAIAVVVSLLVVRSCGYRLLRLPSRREK